MEKFRKFTDETTVKNIIFFIKKKKGINTFVPILSEKKTILHLILKGIYTPIIIIIKLILLIIFSISYNLYYWFYFILLYMVPNSKRNLNRWFDFIIIRLCLFIFGFYNINVIKRDPLTNKVLRFFKKN
jgi:hypothetical protein